MYDPHDPHDRDDGEGDRFEVHAALAEAIVKLMCVSLLSIAEDTAEHHADMMTTLDLIGLRILQHNYRPGEIDRALQAADQHCSDIKDFFTEAVRLAKEGERPKETPQ